MPGTYIHRFANLRTDRGRNRYPDSLIHTDTILKMKGSKPLLKYRQKDRIKLCCEIDLEKLLPTKAERVRFENNWQAFFDSDKANSEIFKIYGHKLIYESEQLIPSKTDDRPPLLFVFGNPASHSIYAGMFFASEGNRKEHRFWKDILKPAGVLELPNIDNCPIDKVNDLKRRQLLELNYTGPFRIGLCVFISMPSAPGGKWGGVAGVQRLIGTKAFKRLGIEETDRVRECAGKFLGPSGKAIIFQKNAWTTLRSDTDPEYRIDLAKKGMLRGRFKYAPGIEIMGVPPTRLSGPCRRVLEMMTKTDAASQS